jgi:uncharacterized protein YkwD
MRATRLIATACLLAVASGCTSTASPELSDSDTTRGKAICTIPETDQEIIEDVLVLINDLRAEAGVASLVPNETLIRVAESYACEMVEEDFFAHENPETGIGSGERLTSAGYIYWAMGENLAVAQTSAEEVVAAWMNSPRHRENILDPSWREVGMAVRTGGTYGWYWVQEFADPVDYAGR